MCKGFMYHVCCYMYSTSLCSFVTIYIYITILKPMYSKFVIIAWNKLFALTLFPEIIQRPSFFGKFLLRSFPFPRWWSSHGFGAARRRLFSGSGGDFLYCWLVQTFVYVSIEDQVVCSHFATTYRTGGCGALYKQRRTTREISHSAYILGGGMM